jgi:RHS repeat-associated protein
VHEGIQNGRSSLKYIMTPEGRILNTGNDSVAVWNWEYYLKDHLGNVRVVIEPTSTPGYSNVLQENHYYPFGMRMSQLSSSANSTNKYLFGGKLLDNDFGLNWYDFGKRFYDPMVNRFWTIDPLAENYIWQSPYCYAANNPIKYIDINGEGPGFGPTFISVANLNIFLKIATYTDVNDLVVLGSSLLSPITGTGPINADGTPATSDDVQAAEMGLFIPLASGSGAKKAINAAEDIVEDASTVSKINKNANNAESNFMLYEVKDKDGSVLKVGKADANRTNSMGDPVRMAASERKAQKTHPGATSEKVQDLGTTTTGQAKEAEAARVREHRANGNALPLNKERDKRYNNQ